jgi:hypothetical protein
MQSPARDLALREFLSTFDRTRLTRAADVHLCHLR